jgi:hypothetical protein
VTFCLINICTMRMHSLCNWRKSKFSDDVDTVDDDVDDAILK